MKPGIEERITSAFADYHATAALLKTLAARREYPHELVILACSRLDGLANLAMTQKKTQRDRFVSFLHNYSGRRRELEQVALPNVYMQLFLEFITLPATLPRAGRMYVQDVSRQTPFLQFIVDSGIAIEEKEVSKLLHRLSVWLQRTYRTTVTQAKSKPYCDTVRNIMSHFYGCSRSHRKGFYGPAVTALPSFLNNFRLGEILYRDYRSSSIHEFNFNVDDRFFTESGTYVATRFHAWDSTRFLELCVSAHWLIALYTASVENYKRALIARKKLPFELWVRLCDEATETAFLDDSSIQVGRDLSARVER
jgi:hypothetical protein